jgi:hypothetical protein
MASTIAFVPFGEDSFLFEMTMHSGGLEPDRMSAAGLAGGSTAHAFIAAR